MENIKNKREVAIAYRGIRDTRNLLWYHVASQRYDIERKPIAEKMDSIIEQFKNENRSVSVTFLTVASVMARGMRMVDNDKMWRVAREITALGLKPLV